MKNVNKERQYCESDSAAGAASVPNYVIEEAPARADSWLARAVQFVVIWNEKRIQYNLLKSLTDTQLKDIGLSKADIDKEYKGGKGSF